MNIIWHARIFISFVLAASATTNEMNILACHIIPQHLVILGIFFTTPQESAGTPRLLIFICIVTLLRFHRNILDIVKAFLLKVINRHLVNLNLMPTKKGKKIECQKDGFSMDTAIILTTSPPRQFLSF